MQNRKDECYRCGLPRASTIHAITSDNAEIRRSAHAFEEDPRLFLWEIDGSSAGEFIPAPGQHRPSRIVIDARVYDQDPRDADRYLRM